MPHLKWQNFCQLKSQALSLSSLPLLPVLSHTAGHCHHSGLINSYVSTSERFFLPSLPRLSLAHFPILFYSLNCWCVIYNKYLFVYLFITCALLSNKGKEIFSWSLFFNLLHQKECVCNTKSVLQKLALVLEFFNQLAVMVLMEM